MQPQRVRQPDSTRVERAADDDTGDAVRLGGQQRGDVLQRADAAGGDHRNVDRLRQRARGGDIDALLRAVALDVRIDDARGTAARQPTREVDGRHRAGLQPALHRNLAVACVDADRNAAGEATAGIGDHCRLLQCGGAKDHSIRPQRQDRPGALDRADAAADLDRDRQLGAQRRYGIAIHRRTAHRAVEIDDVQIACAFVRPAATHRNRIVAVDGLRSHVAAQQADTSSALQVDCRNDEHAEPR